MAVNKVTYGGKTLVDLTSDSVSPDKLAAGVTAHDKSGNKITGTMSANVKIYEITLAESSGWTLLTALDADVLAHINDKSLVVSFVCLDTYTYTFYGGRMFIATNNPIGIHYENPVYGATSRQPNAEWMQWLPLMYPANYTGTSDSLGGYGTFRFYNNSYYLRPADGCIPAGNYRLTFVW